MSNQVEKDWVDLVMHGNVPTATMKHVLMTIAALANENGRCRPSIARLAILTGLDPRTITRTLKKLEDSLWLYIDRPGTRANNETNFYMLSARKCRIDKVDLTSRTKKYRPKKVGAEDPLGRGTTPPNTKTPAPRPTAAPKAQAGGSGAGSSVKENIDANGDSQFWDFLEDETEMSPFEIESIEPEAETSQPVAIENPFSGREYITRGEANRAFKLGISPFDLPDIRDEPD
jgi:hypothetical protein